ncbi:MAG: hypothetical protein ONB44_06460 [candidate division KSB1 bacterium]|nr:hypothetical protein [candidate division KSB1 bacterium]MDZ7301765.1 hypothetical protein [candidate division KSB1 bacterium]
MHGYYEKSFLFILSVFLLVGWVSCETRIPARDATAERVAISSILIAGASEQHLLMTAIVKNIGDSLRYVQDAHVEVNGFPFTPISLDRINPQNPHNWVTTDLKIECGQICSLRVLYKERIIRGQTIVPSSLEPVTIKNDTIRWHHDPSHFGYSVSLNEAHVSHIGEAYFGIRYFPPGRYRLQIRAYDQNYERALTTASGSIGLEGAYGLFASACVWQDSVDLR